MDPLLEVAFALAALTYYLGVMIYLIPVPVYGLKRWAPILIEDGLVAALLLSINVGLLHLVEHLVEQLGLNMCLTGLVSRVLQEAIQSAMILLRLVIAVAGATLRFNYAFLFYQVNSILLTTLTALVILSALVSVIAHAKTRLFLVGLLLYSLPFRIGRLAGATLISFVLVNQVMLPLFPYWMNYFYGSMVPQVDVGGGSTAFLWGIVKGIYGYAAGSVVTFRSTENPGEVFTFLAREGGAYYADRPFKGIRYGSYEVVVDYLGYTFTVNDSLRVPEDLKVDTSYPSADYRLDLELPIIVPGYLSAVVLSGCERVSVYSQPNGVLKISCSTGEEVVLVETTYVDGASVELLFASAQLVAFNTSRYVWRGLKVTSNQLVFEVPKNASLTLVIRYVSSGQLESVVPEVSETRYFEEAHVDVFNAIVSASWKFLEFDIIVSMFLFLDTLIVAGLARVLGGRAVRVPIHL